MNSPLTAPPPHSTLHESACTDSLDPFSNNEKKGSEHKKLFKQAGEKVDESFYRSL